MQGQPERARERAARTVERAVVLQVLRDDHQEHWSRPELAEELSGFEPAMLERALARLERDGLVRLDGAHVSASRAVRRLDELELVSV
jgi:DNA-binding HxlR family transcriptional regulator